jgi:hypothetical protein
VHAQPIVGYGFVFTLAKAANLPLLYSIISLAQIFHAESALDGSAHRGQRGSRVSRDGVPSEASDGTKNALITRHISATQGQRMELAAIS